jgi:hypothetical protein
MEKRKNKIDFSLLGIKTEQFALEEENYSSKGKTGLSTSLQFKFEPSDKQIGVFSTFKFLQSKKIFVKIEVSCHFKVGDESWNTFIQLDESKLVVPKDFLAHLATITTGTTRGILFSKTEGTIFSKYIIPIINVVDQIEDDASLDLEIA